MIGKYSDYVYYNGTSTPVVGIFVSVYNAGTQTLATLFNSVGVGIDNPVMTDQTGLFTFFVEAGDYDLWTYGVKDGTVSVNASAGGGDVFGPVSSINNEVALFNSTTGKFIKGGGLLGTAAHSDSTSFAPAMPASDNKQYVAKNQAWQEVVVPPTYTDADAQAATGVTYGTATVSTTSGSFQVRNIKFMTTTPSISDFNANCDMIAVIP